LPTPFDKRTNTSDEDSRAGVPPAADAGGVHSKGADTSVIASPVERAASWSADGAASWSRKHTWAAVLVLLPALAVRLGWPSTISFGGEQIDSIALAWRAWHEGLPERGLRVSVGVDMPPIFLWFLMIPVAVTRDPILVTAAFALANLAGLALLGFALRRSLGVRIAWMTVLLLASAPWSVLFSRKIWAQDLILPLHALFLWTLVRWLEQRTRGRAIAAIVAIGLLFQVYPGTWFLGLAFLVWAVVFRVRIPWRDFAIGCAIALITYAPWIHYQVVSGFDGFWLALSQRGAEGSAPDAASWSRSTADLFLLPFHVAGGSRLDLAIGLDAYELWAYSLSDAVLLGLQQGVFALAGGSFLLASAWTIRRALRRGAEPTNSTSLVLGLCVIEIVAVVAQFAWLRLGAIPHYAIVLALPVCVVFAWGLDRAARRLAPRRPGSGFAVAAGIALLHAATSASLLEFIRTRPEKIYIVYLPPYGHARAELDGALDRALDDVLHGDDRRRERRDRFAERFDESDSVLLRLDPDNPSTGFADLRMLELVGGSEGVAWRTFGPDTWCSIAPFAIPPGKPIVLKLDLTVPADAMIHLFFQRESVPKWNRRQIVEIPLRAGRTCEFVLIDAPDILPRLGLRMGVHSATIHALEIRAVDR